MATIIGAAGGITKLSELEIDAAKNWQAEAITNLGYVIIADGAGFYLRLPKLTTAERDALTPVDGMVIFNTTTDQIERYKAGAWGAMGGISALSELSIDADKDWQAKAITNLQTIAAAMAKGDIPVRGGTILQNLIPGAVSNVLTSAGPGHLPTWQPPGGQFERYIAAVIDLLDAEAIVAIDQSHNENAPIASPYGLQTQEPAEVNPTWFRLLAPAVALIDAEAIVAADKSHNENVPIATGISLKKVVDGAVADDGGVQTDETVAAQNPTVDDMTLLPAAPAVDDAYYWGFNYKFDMVWQNVSTAGVGNWALAHEYWNGAAWVALSDVVDDTSEFTIAGTNKIRFTRPGDWALTTIQGMNLYWVRARVVSFVSITTQPLGAQAWCEILI